jgi:hypothetical protein
MTRDTGPLIDNVEVAELRHAATPPVTGGRIDRPLPSDL